MAEARPHHSGGHNQNAGNVDRLLLDEFRRPGNDRSDVRLVRRPLPDSIAQGGTAPVTALTISAWMSGLLNAASDGAFCGWFSSFLITV